MDDFEYENEQALIESFEEAIEAAATPMGALAAAYNHAPHSVIREWLNHRAADILALELPNVRAMLREGPAGLVTDREDMREVFAEGLAHMAATDPDSVPSATVQQIGEDLAELIEANVGRVMLEETQYNRKVWLDMLSAHAQIVAGLASLPLTEEQKGLVAEVAALDRLEDEDGYSSALH